MISFARRGSLGGSTTGVVLAESGAGPTPNAMDSSKSKLGLGRKADTMGTASPMKVEAREGKGDAREVKRMEKLLSKDGKR